MGTILFMPEIVVGNGWADYLMDEIVIVW